MSQHVYAIHDLRVTFHFAPPAHGSVVVSIVPHTFADDAFDEGETNNILAQKEAVFDKWEHARRWGDALADILFEEDIRSIGDLWVYAENIVDATEEDIDGPNKDIVNTTAFCVEQKVIVDSHLHRFLMMSSLSTEVGDTDPEYRVDLLEDAARRVGVDDHGYTKWSDLVRMVNVVQAEDDLL